jgi:hypothetical protein
LLNSTFPHPALLPHSPALLLSLSIHGKSSDTPSRTSFSDSPCAYLTPYHSQTSHEDAKKASLKIRFVIVGGGAAGLACAVALRRVGHHVTLLEKEPNFVGVSNRRFHPPHPWAYPRLSPGEHSPRSPHVTKYDQNLQLLGDERQGGRYCNRRRARNHVQMCVPFKIALSPPFLSPPKVESAYLLGIHNWEYEMLQEAGGEFMAISVSLLTSTAQKLS